MGIKFRKVFSNQELIAIEIILNHEGLIHQEVYIRIDQNRGLTGVRSGLLTPGFNDNFVYEDIIEVDTK